MESSLKPHCMLLENLLYVTFMLEWYHQFSFEDNSVLHLLTVSIIFSGKIFLYLTDLVLEIKIPDDIKCNEKYDSVLETLFGNIGLLKVTLKAFLIAF